MQTSPSSWGVALLIALVAACSTASPGGAPQPFRCGAIERLHTQNGVYLASQPSAADVEALARCGVKTVLDLRAPTEDRGFDERKTVEAAGLRYVNVPFDSPAAMTDAVLDQSRAALTEGPAPVVMHCKSANRVGAVWMAHRVLDDGVPVEQAVAEAKTVGLHSPELEQRVRDYVAARR